MNHAEVRQENGYWSVYFNGRCVIHDESFAVADGIADCLNGRGSPLGELREVAAAIVARS